MKIWLTLVFVVSWQANGQGATMKEQIDSLAEMVPKLQIDMYEHNEEVIAALADLFRKSSAESNGILGEMGEKFFNIDAVLLHPVSDNQAETTCLQVRREMQEARKLMRHIRLLTGALESALNSPGYCPTRFKNLMKRLHKQITRLAAIYPHTYDRRERRVSYQWQPQRKHIQVLATGQVTTAKPLYVLWLEAETISAGAIEWLPEQSPFDLQLSAHEGVIHIEWLTSTAEYCSPSHRPNIRGRYMASTDNEGLLRQEFSLVFGASSR